MRGIWLRLLAIAVLATAGCSAPVERRHPVFESVAARYQSEPLAPQDAALAEHGFRWQEQGPLELLEFLEDEYREARDAGHEAPLLGGYTVWGTHRGWIQTRDIPALIERLDSTAPCLSVRKAISSFLGEGPSTVGREAAFLIEGFRADVEETGYGGYPALLSSVRGFDYDPQEIRSWWQEYRRSR